METIATDIEVSGVNEDFSREHDILNVAIERANEPNVNERVNAFAIKYFGRQGRLINDYEPEHYYDTEYKIYSIDSGGLIVRVEFMFRTSDTDDIITSVYGKVVWVRYAPVSNLAELMSFDLESYDRGNDTMDQYLKRDRTPRSFDKLGLSFNSILFDLHVRYSPDYDEDLDVTDDTIEVDVS